MEKHRITVQVLSMIDGSVREVIANVPADSEQSAVDKLFAIAKDEMAYKYLGMDGILVPSDCPIPPITTKYALGEWYAKA